MTEKMLRVEKTGSSLAFYISVDSTFGNTTCYYLTASASSDYMYFKYYSPTRKSMYSTLEFHLRLDLGIFMI